MWGGRGKTWWTCCEATFELTLLFQKGWRALPGDVPHLEHAHLSLPTIKTNTKLVVSRAKSQSTCFIQTREQHNSWGRWVGQRCHCCPPNSQHWIWSHWKTQLTRDVWDEEEVPVVACSFIWPTQVTNWELLGWKTYFISNVSAQMYIKVKKYTL